jgi:tetratricopeptide (TPR) repeat protein
MRSAGCRRALATLLVALGCAPVVAVQRPVPAEIDLGPKVRTLALVTVEGTPEAAAQVARTLQARAMRQDYFRLVLWSEGMAADGAGRTGYLSIEIAEWTQEEVQTGGGTEQRARVRLLTRTGRTPEGPWGEPYESGGSLNGVVGTSEPRRPQLLGGACLRAVDDLLSALAPRPQVEEVTLDTTDARLRAGAALASRGALDEARAALETVHEEHPDLPGAAYDLGVVREALGDWEGAEVLYAEAVRLRDEKLYRDALDSVRKRLRSAQSGFPP